MHPWLMTLERFEFLQQAHSLWPHERMKRTSSQILIAVFESQNLLPFIYHFLPETNNFRQISRIIAHKMTNQNLVELIFGNTSQHGRFN